MVWFEIVTISLSSGTLLRKALCSEDLDSNCSLVKGMA